MKVLIYGSSGWIGSQFVKLLEQASVEYVCGISRVNHESDVLSEVRNVMPTHVVSFIGRTHGEINGKVYKTIDYLEQDGKLLENIRDNLFSPLLLSRICLEERVHYTYLGTGCIFTYDDKHPYGIEMTGFTEQCEPNFFGSSYSVVKGFTDRLLQLDGENTLNLRIRMPITGDINDRNFITKIVNYEKVCSVPNSMTVLPDLLPYVLKMMRMQLTGTMNLTNPGLISHNEILDMYKEIVDPSFEYINFSQEEQRQVLAAERSNNYLSTKKLELIFPNVKHVKESIRDVLFEYKNNMSR